MTTMRRLSPAARRAARQTARPGHKLAKELMVGDRVLFGRDGVTYTVTRTYKPVKIKLGEDMRSSVERARVGHSCRQGGKIKWLIDVVCTSSAHGREERSLFCLDQVKLAQVKLAK